MRPHPLKEGPNGQHWKTLPEICMYLHMHHSGSTEDLQPDEYLDTLKYLTERVDRWELRPHGTPASKMFDAQVYSMCLIVLDEAREHTQRFYTTPEIVHEHQ